MFVIEYRSRLNTPRGYVGNLADPVESPDVARKFQTAADAMAWIAANPMREGLVHAGWHRTIAPTAEARPVKPDAEGLAVVDR